MTLAFEVAGRTDVGCVRTNNEDSFAFDLTTGLFVVCDGMGGRAAGEVASEMAVNTLVEYFRATSGGDSGRKSDYYASERTLAAAIAIANNRIREAAAMIPSQAGMGSTLVAALWDGDSVSIANVGDSRIYLIRNHKIQQLTTDHSLVMEEVRSGLISLEEARYSRKQNFILRALGAEDSVMPDLATVPVIPQDLLLLTTDGLVRHVDDAGILEIAESAATLQEACDLLIQRAKDEGGSDNVTCLMIRAVEQIG
jgi:serine/threonine protein phosphatase PrpC